MMYLKKQKIRDRKYLNTARDRSCCVCGSRQGVVMHHIRYGTDCGTGVKSSDDLTIPLDYKCHDDCHRYGEKAFYKKHSWIWNGDVLQYARELYKEYLTNCK